EAFTVYAPAVLFAVIDGDVATPEALVATTLLPPNTALAPVVATANVTVAFGTGLLAASRTVAVSTAPNAVPTVALCGAPLVAVIDAGRPTTFVSDHDALPAPSAAAV